MRRSSAGYYYAEEHILDEAKQREGMKWNKKISHT